MINDNDNICINMPSVCGGCAISSSLPRFERLYSL